MSTELSLTSPSDTELMNMSWEEKLARLNMHIKKAWAAETTGKDMLWELHRAERYLWGLKLRALEIMSQEHWQQRESFNSEGNRKEMSAL